MAREIWKEKAKMRRNRKRKEKKTVKGIRCIII